LLAEKISYSFVHEVNERFSSVIHPIACHCNIAIYGNPTIGS